MPNKPTRKASNARLQEAAGKPRPLDHPTNWLPVDELNGPLIQRNGGVRHLAALDLNEALHGPTRQARRVQTAAAHVLGRL